MCAVPNIIIIIIIKTRRDWTKIQENILVYGKKLALSIHSKLMVYKQILQPVWTYGIQLWGCAEHSNTDIVQRFQNMVVRNIVDAPWYIGNADLHRDLQMETATNETGKFSKKHEEWLLRYDNVDAIQLLDNTELVIGLKKNFLNWCMGKQGKVHPCTGTEALYRPYGPYGGVEVQLYSFLTTALEGGEGSASRPGRSLPPGKTRYPLYRRLGGPQGRSGQVRKISPPPGFDPRTVQPVASRYTDYAGRPNLSWCDH